MTHVDAAWVYRVTAARPSTCSCAQCRAMCTRSVCLGTPADILELVHHGYASVLEPTLWMVADPDNPIPMVQLRQTRRGCPMHAAGRCTLQHCKPTEGVLASHAHRSRLNTSPAFAVAVTWLMPRNRKLIAHLFRIVQQPKTAPIIL